MQNGYPAGIINFNINNVLRKQQETRTDNVIQTVPKKEVLIQLPYLGLQSNSLKQQLIKVVGSTYGCVKLIVVFTNTSRLRSFFQYKDKLNRSQLSKVVYRAGCWDCDATYIGKTQRRLHDRKKEHFQAIKNNHQHSSIVNHMKNTGHKIKWDHFDVIESGKTNRHCLIKESLLIRELSPQLNENKGNEKLFLY